MMKEIHFTPPFRVGRKQQRAVLDAQGKEVVIFPFGLEEYAKEYAEFLNMKNNSENTIDLEAQKRYENICMSIWKNQLNKKEIKNKSKS